MYYIVEAQEININCFIITLHLYVCMEKKRMDYLLLNPTISNTQNDYGILISFISIHKIEKT
jgi:hypothetical protein